MDFDTAAKCIMDMASLLDVPKWIESGKKATCNCCQDLFKKGHQHNCRLCGNLYCSACTIKVAVPDRFRLKGKKGPVRVCLACKAICIAQHNSKQTGSEVEQVQDKVLYADDWQEVSTYKGCGKCGKAGGVLNKPINCFVCGRLHCKACCSNVHDLPTIFHRDKKVSKTLICDECRFFIKAGATLSETPRPDPSAVVEEEQPDPSRRMTMREKREMKKRARSSKFGAAFWQNLVVHYEGMDTLVELEVEANMTLQEVDEILQERSPQSNFQYLCRGQPVHTVFWDIVMAKHLLPKLTLRRGGVDSKITFAVQEEQDLRYRTAKSLSVDGDDEKAPPRTFQAPSLAQLPAAAKATPGPPPLPTPPPLPASGGGNDTPDTDAKTGTGPAQGNAEDILLWRSRNLF